VKINRIKLVNYRRFREAEIQFPEGLICLVGRNGAGKTTILESIGWAIYGHGASRTKKELIKRSGSGPNEPVEVELDFELGGSEYSVKRSMVGRNLASKAEVRVDGKIVLPSGPNSAQECTRFLSSALHLDEHSFHTSLIARQKELDMLSQLRPHERKGLIMRMLRVDVIDGGIELARRDIRGKKDLISSLEPLVPDIAQLEREGRELEGRRDELHDKVERARMEVEALKKGVEKCDERRRELKGSYEKYLALKERASINASKLEDLDERLWDGGKRLTQLKEKEVEARWLARAPQELEELDRELKHLDEEREKEANRKRIEAEKGERILEIQELEEKVEKLKIGAKSISELLKAPVESIEALNDELLALKLRITEIEMGREKVIQELEEISVRSQEMRELGPESKCPTCERRLGPQYRLLLRKYGDGEAELKRSLAWMEREMAEGSKAIEILEERLSSARAREERKRSRESKLREIELETEGEEKRLHDLRENVSKLEEEARGQRNEFDLVRYDHLRSERKIVEAKVDRYKELLVELRQREDLEKDLDQLSKKRDEIAYSLGALRKELSELGDAKLLYEEALQDLERANEGLKLKEIELEKLVATFDSIEGEMKRVRTSLAEGRKIVERIDSEKEELTLLNELAGDRASLLNEFRDDVIARIRPGISALGSELLSEITEGKYDELSVDDDYGVWIYEDGEPFPIERFSGGETDVANLCLRIAISRLVAERSNLELDFIALDEIFGSQDPERRENILCALGALLNRFSQIVLITHIEEVREKVPNPIEVLEREDGTSFIQ
jgi:exonuclease SbcC